jgi:hypothetical protein
MAAGAGGIVAIGADHVLAPLVIGLGAGRGRSGGERAAGANAYASLPRSGRSGGRSMSAILTTTPATLTGSPRRTYAGSLRQLNLGGHSAKRDRRRYDAGRR